MQERVADGAPPQLMEQDARGLVSVRGLAAAAGLSARADGARRLRALYCAHAPPLLDALDLRAPADSGTGEELAADAISFFDSLENPASPEPGLQSSISEACDGQPMDKSTDSSYSQSGKSFKSFNNNLNKHLKNYPVVKVKV